MEKLSPPPTILIMGTQGVGKTTVASKVAEAVGFEHINVSELIKKERLTWFKWSEQWTGMFNELLVRERVGDILKANANKPGTVVDFHSGDIFGELWFDYVFVLRTEPTELERRLKEKKLSEDDIRICLEVESERSQFFQAVEHFPSEVVKEIMNHKPENLGETVETITKMLRELPRIRAQRSWAPCIHPFVIPRDIDPFNAISRVLSVDL